MRFASGSSRSPPFKPVESGLASSTFLGRPGLRRRPASICVLTAVFLEVSGWFGARSWYPATRTLKCVIKLRASYIGRPVCGLIHRQTGCKRPRPSGNRRYSKLSTPQRNAAERRKLKRR